MAALNNVHELRTDLFQMSLSLLLLSHSTKNIFNTDVLFFLLTARYVFEHTERYNACGQGYGSVKHCGTHTLKNRDAMLGRSVVYPFGITAVLDYLKHLDG